jgi:ABC-type lipoprotein release transport system permease subunit
VNLVLSLAWRNVLAYRVKNLVVGGILAFGTFIVVTGSALLGSLEEAMRQGITQSLTGELQVYAKDARDPLSMLGTMDMSAQDYGEIEDFAALADVAATVPGVTETIPMARGQSIVFGGNDIDLVLADLRSAVSRGEIAKIDPLLSRVLRIARDLEPELDAQATFTSDLEALAADRATLARVLGESFRAEFDVDPIGTVDWLDGHLAPMATDGKLTYLSILGTDLDAFAKSFPKFQLVQGEMVPPGTRGALLPEGYHRLWLKHVVARELDQIRDEVVLDQKTIGSEGPLYDRVQRNARQYRRVMYQLDPAVADALLPKLRAEVGNADADLGQALQSFLQVSDDNVVARHAFFEAEIAPHIRLYDIKVGDIVPLRSVTKTGYMKSLNVKVYGLYAFEGQRSRDLMTDQATLVDMVSFRALYGKMTDGQRDELADIKASVGAQEVSGDVEAALFGGEANLEETLAAPAAATSDPLADLGAARDRVADTFDPATQRQGLALNAAVRLAEPARIEEGAADLQAAIDAAGLPLQVVDWKTSSGVVGQLVSVVSAVVVLGVGVMFLVSLVIINNALVMSTMERTGEIGTMRAVGATRRFVLSLFVVETVLVGLAAGVVGAGASAAFVGWLGARGIPAGSDFFSLLFGGPKLFPAVDAGDVILGVVLVGIVSAIATLYPARMAASVPPVVALQGKE